ncbi:MAG TPA: molybdenum cofactor guanylyltransferase [Sphingomicrobium sp.]|nr:molybdenum cofactor guanylyltransferase [Sphingomicrobium sp.]
MKIAAVILAGGEGRRIGGGKPLRRLGGTSLLERAVRQARQWSDAVSVAVRDEGQLGATDLRTVLDEPEIAGPLGGLAAGLAFARDTGRDALLSLPADMPFLPEDFSPRLEQAIGGGLAALASSGGHLHPVCGLWRIGALDRLPGYLGSGKRSLKGFAEFVGFTTVDWPAGPPDPFLNINSAEDLASAERLVRG